MSDLGIVVSECLGSYYLMCQRQVVVGEEPIMHLANLCVGVVLCTHVAVLHEHISLTHLVAVLA